MKPSNDSLSSAIRLEKIHQTILTSWAVLFSSVAFVLFIAAAHLVETSIQLDLLTQSEYFIRFVGYS
jgi:hypothetical protein